MKVERGITAGQLAEALAMLPPDTPIRLPDNQGGQGWLERVNVVFQTDETEIVPGFGTLPIPPHLELR